MSCMSLNQLRRWFGAHQRYLAAGDKLPTITDIARRAGCHRDTIYALLEGNRISGHIQHALSIVIERLEVENNHLKRTNLFNVQLSATGPKIGFGTSVQPLFRTGR
jgi:hypothetical protein